MYLTRREALRLGALSALSTAGGFMAQNSVLINKKATAVSVNDFSVEVAQTTDEMITMGRNNSIPRPVTFGGANWSFAMWIKLQSTTPLKGTNLVLFDDVDFNGIDLITEKNRKWIAVYEDTGDFHFEVYLVDTDGSTFIDWDFDGAGGIETVYTNGLNEWNFVCVTYDEAQSGVGNIISVYMNGSKLSPSTTTGTSITADLDVTTFRYLNYGMGAFGAGGPKFSTPDMAAARYHRAGLWNVTLSEAEQNVLYNAGAGAAVDWRSDSGAYVSSSDLDHYYLFGKDQSNLVAGGSASGGCQDGSGVIGTGTGLGMSTLWDCGYSTSSGWDANGSDLGVGFPDFVEDAPTG